MWQRVLVVFQLCRLVFSVCSNTNFQDAIVCEKKK